MPINLTGIQSGIAKAVTTFQDVRSFIDLTKSGGILNLKSELGLTGSSQGKNLNTLDNPLEKFASYNCLWTMACLTKQQFNDPRSYRNSPADLKSIVFSSAGRYDGQRVKTLFGSPEYFVNNFEMVCQISPTTATGNSNAISFKFEIYEPYSMGLFLQSLQRAAVDAGHVNYLSNTPFVLKLDFVGYDDSGRSYTGVKSKYFTIRLRKTDFKVTESGSVYSVEAVPFNHLGYGSNTNLLTTDIAAVGNTVKELLVEGERSMARALNDAQQQLVKAKKKKLPDIYEVQFPSSQEELINALNNPTTNSAATDPGEIPGITVGSKPSLSANYGDNEIGKADMGFDQSSGGNYVFKKDDVSRDPKTGKITKDKMVIDPKLRTFQFQQGQTITNVITQVVTMSKYCVDNVAKAKIDPEGMIDWFKVDVQVQLLEFDDSIGDYQKKWIYRVVPSKTHSSVFMNPKSAPPGYDELERRSVAKKYEYIYTGQNNSILNFDIQINKMFYTGINMRPEGDTGQAADPNANKAADDGTQKTKVNEGVSDAALAGNLGSRTLGPDPSKPGSINGGSGDVTEEKKIAENFQKALLNSNTDLVNIEIEILGDPYWIIDSGMGNYLSPPNPNFPAVTLDGTMNYETRDIHVYLTFRTPADIDENTGMYKFRSGEITSEFSGLYRVKKCHNKFSDGAFKQRLELIRMPLQPSDFDGKPQRTDKQSTLAVGLDQKVKTNPNELLGPF
jgi:hypothetical protein